MTKTPKKPKTKAPEPKPSPTNEATGSSTHAPATTVPPKKVPNPALTGPPIDCDQDQLWEIYMSFPDKEVSAKMVHGALLAKGIKASYNWVNQRLAKWDFPRKRAMALAGTSHPADFDETKIRNYLEKLGKSFNPAETLAGVQTRILAVISSKMINEPPQQLQEYMKLYGMMTDELKRNYQKRLETGEIIDLPKAKVDDESKVTPFKKREGTKP